MKAAAGVRLPPLSNKKKKKSKRKAGAGQLQAKDQLTPTDSDYIALINSKQDQNEREISHENDRPLSAAKGNVSEDQTPPGKEPEISPCTQVNVQPTSAAKENVPEDTPGEEIGEDPQDGATVIRNELADHDSDHYRPSPVSSALQPGNHVVRPLSAPNVELAEEPVSKTPEPEIAITEEPAERPRVEAWTPSASVYDSDELDEQVVGRAVESAGSVGGKHKQTDEGKDHELGVEKVEESLSFLRRSSQQGKKFKVAVTKVLLDKM